MLAQTLASLIIVIIANASRSHEMKVGACTFATAMGLPNAKLRQLSKLARRAGRTYTPNMAVSHNVEDVSAR